MVDLQEHLAEFESLDAQVIAASSDPEQGARHAAKEWGLEYTVLYDLDAKAISDAIGCYTGEHDGQPHIQPASFVLDRTGHVAHAVYSTGRVGRLTAADALTIVRDLGT